MVQPPANVTFVWTSWPMDQLETLFQMWQSFAPKTDARFTSELYMSSSGAGFLLPRCGMRRTAASRRATQGSIRYAARVKLAEQLISESS